MGIEIDIACPDRTFMGYLSMPEHKVGPGVILLHDKFGIDTVLRSRADALSQKLGVFVLIPDLFWRQQPCLNLNALSQPDQEKANTLQNSFDFETGSKDTLDTITALREIGGCTGRVGVLGYGLGGRLAFMASARSDINASVSYYGAGIENHLTEAIKITNPLLLHFATKGEPGGTATRKQILSSLKDYFMITHHIYLDCRQGFARPGISAFDVENARLADRRSEEFLAANLAF